MASTLLHGGGTISYQRSDVDVDLLHTELRSRYAAQVELAVAEKQRGICIGVDGRDPLANLGRLLEQQVFDNKGGNHSPEVMHEEYGEYEDRSIFLLGVRTSDLTVTSALRMIIGNAGAGPPVKTIFDCVMTDQYQAPFLPNEEEVIDLRDDPAAYSRISGVVGRIPSSATPDFDRVTIERYHGMAPGSMIADIATIVVDPTVRSGDAGLLWAPLLVAGAMRAGRALSIRHAVTFVQETFLISMRNDYGAAWEDLANLPACQYVDGDAYLSQPAYLDLDALWSRAAGLRIDHALGRPVKAGKPSQRLARLMTSPGSDSAFIL